MWECVWVRQCVCEEGGREEGMRASETQGWGRTQGGSGGMPARRRALKPRFWGRWRKGSQKKPLGTCKRGSLVSEIH